MMFKNVYLNWIFTIIALLMILSAMLNLIYMVDHEVDVESLNANIDDRPVIHVNGGVKNYSIMTLGIMQKKFPVRGWSFSGTVTPNKLAKISSVQISTQDSTCFDNNDDSLTTDFQVTTQNQVGKVVNFQIPVVFYLHCEAIMTVHVSENESIKTHTLKYKITPRSRRGIRREWMD